MFHQSKRTAPRVLALHPMAKASFGAPSTPYSVRTMNFRHWQHLDKPAAYFRSVLRSESQMSLKTLASLQSAKSVPAPKPAEPCPPPVSSSPKTSLVETIRAIQWSNLHPHFTTANALQFVRQLPTNAAAAYRTVVDSREYELVRNMAVATCQLTVRLGRTAYLWLGLFLESREYYYLRYYTLLALEQSIVWLRYGLRVTFDLIRSWTAKK
ncbi:uncharacterized protein LOC121593237 isoform X1 [Anopheles merus]|nr:uncharacterized protein LOC121593237 isoform X1 [Anopheles merus]